MSIKRTKRYTPASRDRDAGSGTPLFARKPKEQEPAWDWDQHVASQPDQAFVPYSMKSKFEKGAFVLHPVFGKCLVIAAEGKQIVVLCEAGQKKLAHAL